MPHDCVFEMSHLWVFRIADYHLKYIIILNLFTPQVISVTIKLLNIKILIIKLGFIIMRYGSNVNKKPSDDRSPSQALLTAVRSGDKKECMVNIDRLVSEKTLDNQAKKRLISCAAEIALANRHPEMAKALLSMIVPTSQINQHYQAMLQAHLLRLVDPQITSLCNTNHCECIAYYYSQLDAAHATFSFIESLYYKALNRLDVALASFIFKIAVLKLADPQIVLTIQHHKSIFPLLQKRRKEVLFNLASAAFALGHLELVQFILDNADVINDSVPPGFPRLSLFGRDVLDPALRGWSLSNQLIDQHFPLGKPFVPLPRLLSDNEVAQWLDPRLTTEGEEKRRYLKALLRRQFVLIQTGQKVVHDLSAQSRLNIYYGAVDDWMNVRKSTPDSNYVSSDMKMLYSLYSDLFCTASVFEDSILKSPHQMDPLWLLKSTGADLNAQDEKGNTPLHCALKSGYYHTVFRLLSLGADPNICNKSGECFLDLYAVEVLNLIIASSQAKQREDHEAYEKIDCLVENMLNLRGSIRSIYAEDVLFALKRKLIFYVIDQKNTEFFSVIKPYDFFDVSGSHPIDSRWFNPFRLDVIDHLSSTIESECPSDFIYSILRCLSVDSKDVSWISCSKLRQYLIDHTNPPELLRYALCSCPERFQTVEQQMTQSPPSPQAVFGL
jgi:hypothetical protein